MKRFIAGIIVTLLAIGVGAIGVTHLGLYPIGADNPPGAIEHALASRAMDVYAEKHKPEGPNPDGNHAGESDRGREGIRGTLRLLPRRGEGEGQPDADKFSPPAPQLINKIPHDDDAWLFWVTKHGVRMTGMPSWRRCHVGRGDVESHRVHQAQRQAAAGDRCRVAAAGVRARGNRGAHAEQHEHPAGTPKK